MLFLIINEIDYLLVAYLTSSTYITKIQLNVYKIDVLPGTKEYWILVGPIYKI